MSLYLDKINSSRTLYANLGLFFVLLLLICNVCNAKVIIENARPRLLVNQSDVERIREAVKTYSKEDFEALWNYADRRIKDTSAEKVIDKQYSLTSARSIAFAGLISKETVFIDSAIDYAVALSKTSSSFGNDTAQRHRLLSMSYVYDWLYEYLTPEQKTTIRQGVIDHIDHLKYFLDNPLYTGGHSRYGNAVIIAGLIALYGDYGDWQGNQLLETVENTWEQGYNPFQSYVAKEGGYHMGWLYGSSYTDPLPYLLWEKATGQKWCEDWRSRQAFWFIYGLRGDETLPRSGDCWNANYRVGNIIAIVAVCSGVFQNQYAGWFYQKYFSNIWEPLRIYRIIFRDQTVTPKSPFDKDAPLPLAKHFKNSGFVVARDAWDETTTQLIFKCTPFYTKNHHHKDQNHIELSYKGSLLIDSGSYEPPGYGSSHWQNYYTRTIAHNTIVVFDPDEKFTLYGKTLSNDGGQKFPDYNQEPKGHEPNNLAEATSEKYKIDGIVRFSEGDGCCWTRGDATKAYFASKVQSYIRDVFLVNRPLERNHPCILILDRIELNKKLTPKILFHFNEKPITDNGYFSVTNANGGYLHGEILAPANVQLNLIGGEGKRWWVNGVNYTVENPDQDIDPGWGRLEVGTNVGANKTHFLTLLSVDDVNSFQGRPMSSLVSGDGYYGALFGKNLLLINYSELSPTEWTFSGPEYDHVQRIYLAGVEPNKEYTFKINDSMYKSTSQAGGVVLTKITSPSKFKIIRVE